MTSLYISRQNNQTKMKCKRSDKTIGNVAIHALTECKQMEILVKRFIIIGKFDETFESMEKQDIMIKVLILLGKTPLQKGEKKEQELLRMRIITAEILGEANKYITTV
jgi:hypothetical protein